MSDQPRPGDDPARPAGSGRSDGADGPARSGPDVPGGSAGDVTNAAFARPSGVEDGFAPRYTPPPPTTAPATPAEQAVFGRPRSGAPFDPAPGERLAPRPADHPPVPPVFADAFGADPRARDGFAPAAGDRIGPSGPAPQSPWWKPGAARDPWRDPSSPYWLGRGAVFTAGTPAQLDPDADTEQLESLAEADDGESDDDPPAGNVRHVRFGLSTLGIALAIAVVAGVLGGGAGWFLTREVHDALHRPDVHIAQVEPPVQRDPTSVAGIARRVGPAVVSIQIRTPDEFAIGSGVVIDRNGYVLTNNHVVAPAASADDASIVVTFSNEATAKATIVGRDPVSDLAVIKVPNDELTVATLGDSDKLAVGDPVIAIGSPLGLQGTVTEGIVSALNRPVHVSNDDGSSDAYLDAIQTDAAINPGNSGGALVDSAGAVIGINSAGALGSVGPNGTGAAITGIGYAIPIDYAKGIAEQLIHSGKAVHATLGVTGSTATAGLQVGAYLKQVSPGGPAAKAGLQPGDVVVAADGTPVQSYDQLVVVVQRHRPGDRIDVEYYRNRSTSKSRATVTLG